MAKKPVCLGITKECDEQLDELASFYKASRAWVVETAVRSLAQGVLALKDQKGEQDIPQNQAKMQ